jgi:hypothetical protein
MVLVLLSAVTKPSMSELKSVPLPRPLMLMLPEVKDVVALVVLVDVVTG